MSLHDLLGGTGAATTLQLGRSLRATALDAHLLTPATVSSETLDGVLASIQVGDLGVHVAYRDDVVGLGCTS